MWLIILAFSAATTTALWYSKAENDACMLKFLSLLLWGATIMVLVDHTMGYLMEGGEYLELTTEATVLGIALLIAALVVWEIVLLLKDPKGVLKSHEETLNKRQFQKVKVDNQATTYESESYK